MVGGYLSQFDLRLPVRVSAATATVPILLMYFMFTETLKSAPKPETDKEAPSQSAAKKPSFLQKANPLSFMTLLTKGRRLPKSTN